MKRLGQDFSSRIILRLWKAQQFEQRGGTDQYGRAHDTWILADSLEYRKAIAVRQHHIQHHQHGRTLADEIDCATGAIRNRYLITKVLDHFGYQVAATLIVLY